MTIVIAIVTGIGIAGRVTAILVMEERVTVAATVDTHTLIRVVSRVCRAATLVIRSAEDNQLQNRLRAG